MEKKKVFCKVCGAELTLTKENHYISRDEVKTGLSVIVGGLEEIIYDTFDCQECGCQNVMQERKRHWYTPTNITTDDEEDDKETEE